MCAHEITDRYGGRPVTPGSSDRFYSQLLLLPPCLNSVFSPLRKGRKFSQITTSHMASASSASMVSRWVSLVTCGLLRVGNGGLMRELWYSGLYPYSLQENEAFTKTPCYHYFHCHCLARYIQHMEHELQAQGQEQEQERQHAATKQVGPPDSAYIWHRWLTTFPLRPVQGLLTFLWSWVNTHFCLETGMPVPSVPALGRLGWLSGWAAGDHPGPWSRGVVFFLFRRLLVCSVQCAESPSCMILPH